MKGATLASLGALLRLERRPATVHPDHTYSEIGIYSFGRGIFHKQPRTGLEVGEKDLYLIREGDFILQVTFAWEGAVALASSAEEGMYGSVRFPTFRVVESRCYPPYLNQYFRTRTGRGQLARISPGSAGRNRVLSLKRIPDVMVPLPPLEEQRRIVARIEALAAKVEEARGLRRQAVAEATALLRSALHRSLDVRTAAGHLGRVLLSPPRNGWSARCDGAEGGVSVLSLGAVTGFQYRSAEYKRTSQPTAPGAHYWLNPGDLLLTRSNTPQLVGHAAIYSGVPAPCIYPDLMMRLDIDETRTSKRFVHWWLQSSTAREYVAKTAKGTNPTMKKISQSVVMSLPFPEDLSLAQQHCAVEYLDEVQAEVDAVKQLQAETAAELEALLPSILDRAFKGEL